MVRIPLSLFIALLLTAPAGARADERGERVQRGPASLEFLVKGEGGSFEVPVSQTYVTVIYLPDKVTRALASDKKNFEIYATGNTVSVRPKVTEDGHKANLNIDTQSLHLSIILRVVGKDEEAVSQVFFVRAEEREELNRRVAEEADRITRPLREELEAKQRRLDAHIQERSDAELARRLVERFETRSLDGIRRTDDNVIFRVKKAAFIGEDIYLFFSVQNRRGSPYSLGAVEVTQASRKVAVSRVVFQPGQAAPPKGSLGRVEPEARGSGVIVVAARELSPGRPFALRFIAAGKGAALLIESISLE